MQMANALRLRLSGRGHLGLNGTVGQTDAAGLAWEIAQNTASQLIGAGLLDRGEAMKQMDAYGNRITRETAAGECVLSHLFPEEALLDQAVQALNQAALLQVWEFAHRIAPPDAFYRANPEIGEACRRCGVVILDASTPATVTSGSINPVAGDLFTAWLQAKLSGDGDNRRRFSFHVVIPPRLWTSILRTHFPKTYGA
ncbi:MAG TPA: hypothetical protein VK673_02455 [Chthoniobacterales bacterium]|nr:hypothetical protein [Chthoniobacterales bacterium]